MICVEADTGENRGSPPRDTARVVDMICIRQSATEPEKDQRLRRVGGLSDVFPHRNPLPPRM